MKKNFLFGMAASALIFSASPVYAVTVPPIDFWAHPNVENSTNDSPCAVAGGIIVPQTLFFRDPVAAAYFLHENGAYGGCVDTWVTADADLAFYRLEYQTDYPAYDIYYSYKPDHVLSIDPPYDAKLRGIDFWSMAYQWILGPRGDSGHYFLIRLMSCPIGFTSSPDSDVCVSDTAVVADELPGDCGCDGEGDPIDATSGNVFESEVDFRSPHFNIERNYNSSISSDLAGTMHQNPLTLDEVLKYPKFLGKAPKVPADYTLQVYPSAGTAIDRSRVPVGWIFDFQSTLIAPDGRNIALLVLGNGRRVSYYPSSKTSSYETWTAGGRHAEQLIRNIDGSGATTTWEYRELNGDSRTYDSGGRLISVNKAGVPVLQVNYRKDYWQQIDNIVDLVGARTFTVAYANSYSRAIMSITTPDGGAINYSYDALGNLSTVTYPDRASKTYLYEDNSHPSALTGVMDENRQRYATWKYDTQGRGAISYQGDGRNQVTVSFDTDGQSVTTDSLGAVRTRVLQVAAGVPKVNVYRESYGIGNVRSQSFTYDVNSNVASHTDFNGVTTTYIYDLTRNLETSRTEAKGSPRERTITTIWNSTWALPDTVTEPNRKTKYDYDTSGNLLTKTVTASNGAKRVWSWTYGSYGLVLTATNPDSKTTTYTYDTSRNVATITNPAGQITQFTKYDDNGNLLSMIDINQQTTTFGYDPRGRLKTRKTGSEQTTFDYDLAGQLKVVHFPDGSTLSYDYDAAHRLTDIRDNRNGRIHYDLFDDGNIKREDRYDPDGTLANALQQAKAQRTPPAQQAKAQ